MERNRVKIILNGKMKLHELEKFLINSWRKIKKKLFKNKIFAQLIFPLLGKFWIFRLKFPIFKIKNLINLLSFDRNLSTLSNDTKIFIKLVTLKSYRQENEKFIRNGN